MGASFITNSTGPGDESVRREYEEAVKILEEEKMEEIRAMNQGMQVSEFWWHQNNDGMKLKELEEYLQSLEDLRKNISCRIEDMEKLRMPTYSSPSSVLSVPNQGSMEDTSGGLPVHNDYNNPELQKLVEVDIGDAAADDAQMNNDDGAFGYSNLGTNLAYCCDFDDNSLFSLNYGNSSTFNVLEAFLGGF